MSGYFGALMRSSGMAFADRAPMVAHAEPISAEVDLDRGPAETSSRAPEIGSVPQQTIERIPAADLSEPVAAEARPASPAGAADTQRKQSLPAAPHEGRSRSTADIVKHAPEAPPPVAMAPVGLPTPDLGQQLVRAAMQWVAADPQHSPAAVPVAPLRGEPLPSRGDGISVIAPPAALSQPHRDSAADVDSEPANAPPPMPGVPERAIRESVPPPGLPIRPARPAAVVPPMPMAPASRDEVVEVSIGAIHVRVDAPAAQTVAWPAVAPPAPVSRAASAPSARSALSRRALRRI